MEKYCEIHGKKILHICFYNGCNKHLLCRKCNQEHPNDHEPNIEDIDNLLEDEQWIEKNEKLRNSRIVQLKEILQQKNSLLTENVKTLKEGIDQMKASLEDIQLTWVNELHAEMIILNDPETLELFSRLEDSLEALNNFSLREGDIYDKVNQAKFFSDTLLPNSAQFLEKAKLKIEESKLDSEKVNAYKDQVTEILESVHLKDLLLLKQFTGLAVIQRLKDTQEKNTRLQSQNEELTQLKINQENEIKSLKDENTALKKEKTKKKPFYVLSSLLLLLILLGVKIYTLKNEISTQIIINEELLQLNINQENKVNALRTNSTLRIEELTEVKNNLERDKENLNTAISLRNDQISTLKSEIDDHDFEMKKLAEANQILQSGVVTLNNTIEALNKEIFTQKSEISRLTTSNTQLQNSVATHKNELQDCRKRIRW